MNLASRRDNITDRYGAKCKKYIFPEIGKFYLLVIITKHANKQKLKTTH
jgi:hypothetical protein